MGKYKRGEPIPLHWEGWPEEYVVAGHVTPEEFAAAWDAYEHTPGWTAEYTDGEPAHLWGRWEVCGYRDFGSGQVLGVHREKGRGCFPVTVADARSERELLRRDREREAARG